MQVLAKHSKLLNYNRGKRLNHEAKEECGDALNEKVSKTKRNNKKTQWKERGGGKTQ